MAAEPQPPLLARKALIKCGDETTAGALAGTLALLGANVYNVKCRPGDFFAENTRQPAGNYLGQVAAIVGRQEGLLTFDMDVAPGGPLLVDNASFGALTDLCGYAGSGTVTPSSDQGARVYKSFEVYQDGLKKVILGAAGNITVDFNDGQIVKAHLDIKGVWGGATDVAMPAQAPITAGPFVARGMTITIGGSVPAMINALRLDLGAAVEQRESLTASAGIAHQIVTEILPKATLDPEARKVADQDAFGQLLAGGTAALAVALVSGGHTLTLAAPAMQRMSVGDEERGKRATHPIEVNLCVSAGDDALTLCDRS